jgi:hypothetical protein
MIEHLERLRQRVLERLDSLEALAQEQAAGARTTGGNPGLEADLMRKLADLEDAERRRRAEAERQERDWRESLARLDADRRLLAEAWERVEQERIAYSAAGAPHQRANDHGPPVPNGVPAALAHPGGLVAARSAAADSEPVHPITQAILRQFQTLSSDVRRNAEVHRGSRRAE